MVTSFRIAVDELVEVRSLASSQQPTLSALPSSVTITRRLLCGQQEPSHLPYSESDEERLSMFYEKASCHDELEAQPLRDLFEKGETSPRLQVSAA